jgi:hypothetical protein
MSRNGVITIGGVSFALVIAKLTSKVMSTFIHLDFYTVRFFNFRLVFIVFMHCAT